MYLLLRADVAYEHLRGPYRYRLNQYMSHLPTEANVEPLPDDWWKGRPQERKDFIIEQIAREVEQELNAAKRGPVSYSGLSSYDVIHRLESAISVQWVSTDVRAENALGFTGGRAPRTPG